MIRIRSLSLCLALALASLTGTTFAATDTNTDSRPQTDQSGGKTAGDDSSVNSPGSGQDNDSSDTGSNSDAATGPAAVRTARARRQALAPGTPAAPPRTRTATEARLGYTAPKALPRIRHERQTLAARRPAALHSRGKQ